jgi:hypothetical protein
MLSSIVKSCLYALFTNLLMLNAAHAQASNWEGVWAQTKPQCQCRFYAIDMCDAGKGLPPLLVNRKEVKGPELGCVVKKVVKTTNTSFELQAACTSDGAKGDALIVGAVKRDVLELSITGSIEENWSQGAYKSFPVKCR